MPEIIEEHDDPVPVFVHAPYGLRPTPRLMGYVYGVETWIEELGCFQVVSGNMSESVYSQAARLLKGQGFEQCAIDYGELNGAVFYMLDEDLPFSVVYTQL